MSGPFGSSQWMYNAGSSFYPFQINDSLRFENGSSAVLTRTPSSAGNRRTWTYSCWVKRSTLGSYMSLLAVGTGDGSEDVLKFEPDNTFNFRFSSGSDLTTSMVFRDVSAWYHIVVVADTTQSQSSATASDSRLRFYVNGSQITSLSSSHMPSQNFEFRINTAAQHYIGEFPRVNGHLDGYLAEVNFIDGTAYDASNFGETKDGVWVPKDASGLTFGTNGFYLPFDDSSAIGDDESANTNDFTANNFSAHDVVPDSPTNNFATWNYLSSTNFSYAVTQDGSLKANMGTGTGTGLTGTFSCKGGKWYWENRASNVGNGLSLGITTGSATFSNMNTNGIFYDIFGQKRVFGTTTSGAGASWAAGDIIGMAVDAESAGTIAFYKNNALQFTVTESSILTDDFLPWILNNSSSAGSLSYVNFGQDSTFAGATTAGGNSDGNGVGDFKYAPPSGFLALCSANLPEPVVGPLGDSISTDNFNTVLYTGNGSTQSVTGVGFQPDWTWCKMRTDGGRGHALFDSVRGGNERLDSSSTQNGRTNEGNISFQSDGFNVTSSHPTVNDSGDSAVAWNWYTGASPTSNTNGSITSQVSANTDAGFSIVSYTGTGANATVGHGLSATPEMIIVKVRSTTNNWAVYHSALGNTKALLLDTTNAGLTSSLFWNNTSPTSSVFSVSTGNSVNNSGQTYIAYCFADVEGYSKMGSYVGNGTNQFIYTGFRPAFVISKVTSGADNWRMYDSARIGYNPNNNVLYPNLSNAEDAVTNHVDLLSNGFRWMSDNNNANGHSFIYLAFAKNPFKYANAR